MPPLRSVHLSKSGPFLDRHYPASSVLQACPPPCRPGLPLAGGSRLVRANTDRASRVATSSLLQACRRHYPGGNGPVLQTLAFPDCQRPSPSLRRVGSRIARFEACSAFTLVPACLFAKPPCGGPSRQSASIYIVTSVNRPGCFQPKRQGLGGIRTHWDDAPFHGALRSCGYVE